MVTDFYTNNYKKYNISTSVSLEHACKYFQSYEEMKKVKLEYTQFQSFFV